MKTRRIAAFSLLLVASALIAGPGAMLYAASPCDTSAPMACCGGEDGSAPSPCDCSLSPVTPAPAVVDAPAPDAVVAEAPSPLLAAPGDLQAAVPAPSVAPRARAGPLFVLFSAFLN